MLKEDIAYKTQSGPSIAILKDCSEPLADMCYNHISLPNNYGLEKYQPLK